MVLEVTGEKFWGFEGLGFSRLRAEQVQGLGFKFRV